MRPSGYSPHRLITREFYLNQPQMSTPNTTTPNTTAGTYILSYHGFACTRMWCSVYASKGRGCCESNKCKHQSAQMWPHVFFLHTEKTGGTSVECAVQQTLVQRGLWTNMGHATHDHLKTCTAKCGNTRSIVVISVREPYKYYESLYYYTIAGVNDRRVRSGCATKLLMNHDKISIRKTLSSFAAFMDWVNTSARDTTQSARVHRACGQPCQYDYILHTETLAEDFSSLLSNLGHEPLLLPTLNERRPPPRGNATATFTPSIVKLIDALEQPIFHTFGYNQRILY